MSAAIGTLYFIAFLCACALAWRSWRIAAGGRIEGLLQELASLRASNTRMRLAIEIMNIGSWDHDLLSDQLTLHEGADALFAATGSQVTLGSQVKSMVHPADAQIVPATVARGIHEGGLQRCEFRINRADGKLIWLESFITVHCDAAGTPLRVSGITMDITERKIVFEQLEDQARELEAQAQALEEQTQELEMQTEELETQSRTLQEQAIALAERKKYLRAVIETDPNFIFVKDRSGAFTLVNKALADAYGTTVEDLIGKRDEDFNPNAEEVARFRAMDHQVMDTLEDLVFEETITDAHGNTRWLQTVKRPFLVADGKADHVLGICTDVTALKQLQGQMIQTEKLAAMGEMVAGVVHEINNPLTVISGNAQLLELHPDEEVRESAKAMLRMTDRSHRIVRSMLTFAREGHRTERRPASLSVVIDATLEMCLYKLKKTDIELHIEQEEDLPQVLINENQIQQVLLNLISNAEHALRSMTAEARRITIRVRCTGERLTVCVTDNGAGMPAEVQARIFDPFFTTKDVGEGTGLGLSICHGIVKDHGGALTVESGPGQGTTFTISLPVTPAQALQSEAA